MRLVFTTSPRSAPASACSAALTVEVQSPSGRPAVQNAPLVVDLTGQPAGLGFYGDSACGAAVASVSIVAGAASASFYFRSTQPNTYSIRASAVGGLSASQSATVTVAPAARLSFSNNSHTGTNTPLAGTCRPLTVQLLDAGGTPTIAASDTSVQLSANPATTAPLTFYSTASCSQPLGSVVIPAGTGSVTVYASAWTGTTYTVTALSTGLSSATQAFTARPLVHSGTCLLDTSTTQQACPISAPTPPMTSNVAVFHQVLSSGASLAQAAVTCELISGATLVCRRNAAGAAVMVYWQALELEKMAVTHASASCPTDGGTTALIPTRGPGAFLLLSQRTDSVALEPSTLFTGQSVDAGVELQWGAPCAAGGGGQHVLVQEVHLPGALSQTLIGAVAPGSLAGSVTTGIPAGASGEPMVLTSHQHSGSSATATCDLALRAVNQGSTVAFVRGNGSGDAVCMASALPRVVAERVWLSSSVGVVEAFTVSLAATVLIATVPFPQSFDSTRTVVFSSSQLAGGGQGAGESDLTTGASISDVMAVFALDGGSTFAAEDVVLARGSAQGSARWAGYAVQFGPR